MHGQRRRRSSCSPMKYVDSSGAPLSQNQEELKAARRENIKSDMGKAFGVGGKTKTGVAAVGTLGAKLGIKGFGGTAAGLSTPIGWIALAAAAAIGGGIALGKGVKRKKQRKLFEEGYEESNVGAMEL